MSDADVFAIQRYFPQIYLACHVRHTRARSNSFSLSPTDSRLLGHLDPSAAMSSRDLAKHLGVAASTLTAALDRLERLGYLRRVRSPNDRRRVDLYLAPLGEKAMSGSSVLDGERLQTIIDSLEPRDRRAAVRGLEILARASRSLMVENTKGKSR